LNAPSFMASSLTPFLSYFAIKQSHKLLDYFKHL